MLSRYKKIKEDSRFPAAQDKRHYPFCDDSAAKLLSSFSFYLHLSPSIYKAIGTSWRPQYWMKKQRFAKIWPEKPRKVKL